MLVFILLVGTAANAYASAADDRVTSIPGFSGDFCWNHSSGYLNGTEGHQLFYWYHESTTNAADKPLVLWLSTFIFRLCLVVCVIIVATHVATQSIHGRN